MEDQRLRAAERREQAAEEARRHQDDENRERGAGDPRSGRPEVRATRGAGDPRSGLPEVRATRGAGYPRCGLPEERATRIELPWSIAQATQTEMQIPYLVYLKRHFCRQRRGKECDGTGI